MKQITEICRMIPNYDPWATCGDCYFDEDAANHAVDFFAAHLQLIEGKTAYKPFHLEDWQRAILGNLFGWKRPDGTRRYRTAYIEVPRKNGKTPLMAGVINYVGFCDDEPGAQIYSAAAEREQAALVHRHAAGMINCNPELAEKATIYKTYKSIEYYNGESVYKALSADADTKHGLNAQLIVVDELHVQPNRDLVDTLVTSTASREQPLLIHITTAGWDRESICYEVYDYAKKVLEGLVEDETILPVIYEIKEGEDWQDEEVWAKCNPNLGVSVSIEYLRTQAKKALEIPAYENTFRRLHLNQWTEQESRWLPMHKWRECAETRPIEGRVCFAGLDMSSTTDLSSLVLVFPDDDGGYTSKAYAWIPEENARQREKKDRVPYLQWAREGFIELTPGNVIDYDFVRRRINEIGKIYNIRQIAADRWNSTQLLTQLEGDGFEMLAFGQGFASMSAPSKKLEELILSKELRHGDNPVLNWAASNVNIKQDAAENIKPVKVAGAKRIDPIVALIMALGVAIQAPEKRPSVYESRGILVL
jgi:phage terminase large subunit-like protein